MSFKIQQSKKTKLIAVTFRLRPYTLGQLRKIAFDNGLSIQELANQMIEYCLDEMKSEKES